MREYFKRQKFNFNNFLAFWIVTICFVYFFWVSGGRYDSTQGNNIGEIKTAMIATVAAIVGYYFGSSRNAAVKDDQIDKMINKDQKNNEQSI